MSARTDMGVFFGVLMGAALFFAVFAGALGCTLPEATVVRMLRVALTTFFGIPLAFALLGGLVWGLFSLAGVKP